MLLGKRLRPPMNRTTSMTEFPLDLAPPGATQPATQERPHRHQRERPRAVGVPGDDWLDPRYGAVPTPCGGVVMPGDDWKDPRCGAVRPPRGGVGMSGDDWLEPRYSAIPPPRGGARRSSGDFAAIETAAFLKACGLCKRRLGAGKDIFMYRGHIAYCSLECRQQQINHDERKEKCSTSSRKIDATQATAESSSSGETVAAV